jgi:hypothetical protein
MTRSRLVAGLLVTALALVLGSWSSIVVAGRGHGRDAMDRILNHRKKSVTDVYDRHDYAAADKLIMEDVGGAIMRLVDGKQEDNVVNRDIVCAVFGRVFDRHQIVTESAGALILACVPRVLAKNFKFAQLDAAMRATTDKETLK